MKKIVVLLVAVLTIIKTMPTINLSVSENHISNINQIENNDFAHATHLSSNNKQNIEQSGNITNGGLIAEDDDNVYYGNGESLFKMSKETQTKEKLVDNSNPNSIQLIEDKVYYIDGETYEIFKVSKDGKNNKKIGNNKAYSLNIYNNKLYFMDRYNKLYITSMDLDGKDKKVILDKTINDMMIYRDIIYYLSANQELGQIDIDGLNQEILKNDIMQFDVTNTGIYYIFDPRKDDKPKGLYKIDLDTKKTTKIMNETPYSFNVKNDTIYYNHPKYFNLYKMDLKTRKKTQITGANTSQINIGDNCILYRNLEDGKKVYKITKDGKNRKSLQGNTLVTNIIDLTKEINELEDKELSPKLTRTYNKAVDIISNIITDDMDEYERTKAVHDYVVNNTRYDVETANSFLNGEDSDGNSFMAYGVLINNKGVCQGYAEATQLLLTLAGVESQLVVGEATNDQINYVPHMWNLVTIDNNCYMLDTTWDDPVGDKDIIVYDYFLIDSKTLRETHRWEYDDYPSCNLKYNLK